MFILNSLPSTASDRREVIPTIRNDIATPFLEEKIFDIYVDALSIRQTFRTADNQHMVILIDPDTSRFSGGSENNPNRWCNMTALFERLTDPTILSRDKPFESVVWGKTLLNFDVESKKWCIRNTDTKTMWDQTISLTQRQRVKSTSEMMNYIIHGKSHIRVYLLIAPHKNWGLLMKKTMLRSFRATWLCLKAWIFKDMQTEYVPLTALCFVLSNRLMPSYL